MRASPPPPLFTFLRAVTALRWSQAGFSRQKLGPGSVLRDLLGDCFPIRISEGASRLAGLNSITSSFSGASFESDLEALASLIDRVVEVGFGRIERGALDGFTPDEEWLGPAQETSRGFSWNLQRDLLTREMIEELPKGHPEKARWKRSQSTGAAGNPVDIRSRILSTVANESSAAAYKAWVTMKRGFHPCLKGRLELIQGASPALELRISGCRRDHSAFDLLRRRVRSPGGRSDLFELLLGNDNVPKRVRLSLAGTPDRRMIRAGWNVFRAWIEAVQLDPEKAGTAGTRHAWRQHSKVRGFHITDPYLGLLVAKYENKIDWRSGKITDEATLTDEVRRNLVTTLRKAMKDSCEFVHYEDRLADLSPYLEREDPIGSAATELEEVRLRELPERVVRKAEQLLLNCVLSEKTVEMRRWEVYLTRDNPLYQRNPAFQFMVLDFVAKSSAAGTEAPPVKLDAEALV